MAQLGPIHPGDIVEVDKKGRVFFAKVTHDVTPAAKGMPAYIGILPLDARITYRTASGKEVVAQYRKTKNTRQERVLVDVTPEDV